MSYRDIPVEAKEPVYALDPRGKPVNWKPRNWRYLSEMSYQELHELTGSTLDGERRRHERV